MILSTHSVVGSSISYALRLNPITSFTAGFLSHFLLDAIPHWDYEIESSCIHPEKNHQTNSKELFRDLLKISIDLLIGLSISFVFFDGGNIFAILCGAFGAMFPDFMHLLYSKFPKGLILKFYQFHSWIHSDLKLNDRPILGPVLQIIVVGVFIYAGIYVNKILL